MRATPTDHENPLDTALLNSRPAWYPTKGYPLGLDDGTDEPGTYIAAPRPQYDSLDERVAEWCQEHGIETEQVEPCLLEYWTPDVLLLSNHFVWEHWVENDVRIRCRGREEGDQPDCFALSGEIMERLPGTDNPWWQEKATSRPDRPGLLERPDTELDLPTPEGRPMLVAHSPD